MRLPCLSPEYTFAKFTSSLGWHIGRPYRRFLVFSWQSPAQTFVRRLSEGIQASCPLYQFESQFQDPCRQMSFDLQYILRNLWSYS